MVPLALILIPIGIEIELLKEARKKGEQAGFKSDSPFRRSISGATEPLSIEVGKALSLNLPFNRKENGRDHAPVRF